jgi:hypothetical protein
LVEACYPQVDHAGGRGPVGIALDHVARDTRDDLQLFGEGGPRYIVSVSEEHRTAVESKLASAAVEILGTGIVAEDPTVSIGGRLHISTHDAYEGSRATLSELFR